MAIAPLDNVKLHLKIVTTADDGLLDELALAAESHIDDFCGRSFVGGNFTEDHPGGGRIAFLKNYPVEAVTEVKVDPNRAFGAETVLAATEYHADLETGLIESLGKPFVSQAGGSGRANDFPGTVRVEYTTAEDEVPKAVQRAYVEIIGLWYRTANTMAALGHENKLQTTDGTTVTQYPWAQSGGFRLPPAVVQLLTPYRVPRV